MPPRFAYWTILIDNAPTAFRARDAQELLPTLAQLRRTNEHVVLKWFSGGKLWDSPEAAREARRKPKVVERRGADWRPGGQHRDPRARFTGKKKQGAAKREWRNGGDRKRAQGAPKPFAPKPGGDRRPFAKPWRERNERPSSPPKRRWRGPRRDDKE